MKPDLLTWIITSFILIYIFISSFNFLFEKLALACKSLQWSITSNDLVDARVAQPLPFPTLVTQLSLLAVRLALTEWLYDHQYIRYFSYVAGDWEYLFAVSFHNDWWSWLVLWEKVIFIWKKHISTQLHYNTGKIGLLLNNIMTLPSHLLSITDCYSHKTGYMLLKVLVQPSSRLVSN